MLEIHINLVQASNNVKQVKYNQNVTTFLFPIFTVPTDLLRFREPRTTPTEAKAYPRVEWFDHVEDDPPENTG